MSSQGKLFFQLSVGGSLFKVQYTQLGSLAVEPPPCGYAVAWIERNDNRTHYFWFKLANVSYVLRAKYRALLGLDTSLIEIGESRVVTLDNLTNSFKLTRGIKRIGGNMASDPFVYHKSITKQENSQNKRFDIQLKTIQLGNDYEGMLSDPLSTYISFDA